MSPYLRAHAAYHSGDPPAMPWLVLLDCLLQTGVVISTPVVFLMARPCRVADPPEFHATIDPLQFPEGADCWHIFLAAGSLSALREIVPPTWLPWVSYFRRDGRLRRIPTSAILRRHDQAENANHPRLTDARARAAAGDPIRARGRAGPPR